MVLPQLCRMASPALALPCQLLGCLSLRDGFWQVDSCVLGDLSTPQHSREVGAICGQGEVAVMRKGGGSAAGAGFGHAMQLLEYSHLSTDTGTEGKEDSWHLRAATS